MKIYFRVHAVQRMFERDVSVKKVLGAIETGETIEDYSSEMPEPSRLILGFQGKRPGHVDLRRGRNTGGGDSRRLSSRRAPVSGWRAMHTSKSSGR